MNQVDIFTAKLLDNWAPIISFAVAHFDSKKRHKNEVRGVVQIQAIKAGRHFRKHVRYLIQISEDHKVEVSITIRRNSDKVRYAFVDLRRTGPNCWSFDQRFSAELKGTLFQGEGL